MASVVATVQTWKGLTSRKPKQPLDQLCNLTCAFVGTWIWSLPANPRLIFTGRSTPLNPTFEPPCLAQEMARACYTD